MSNIEQFAYDFLERHGNECENHGLDMFQKIRHDNKTDKILSQITKKKGRTKWKKAYDLFKNTFRERYWDEKYGYKMWDNYYFADADYIFTKMLSKTDLDEDEFYEHIKNEIDLTSDLKMLAYKKMSKKDKKKYDKLAEQGLVPRFRKKSSRKTSSNRKTSSKRKTPPTPPFGPYTPPTPSGGSKTYKKKRPKNKTHKRRK